VRRCTPCWHAFAGTNLRCERRSRAARTSVCALGEWILLGDSFHSFIHHCRLIFSFCLCIKLERIYHRVYHRVSLAYFFFAGSAAFLALVDAASASARALASVLRFCFTEMPFFFVPSRVYPDMDASVEEKAMPEPRPRPPEEAWDGIVMAKALLAAMEAAAHRWKKSGRRQYRERSPPRVGSRDASSRSSMFLTRSERDERRAAIHRFSRRNNGGARLALRANRRRLRTSVKQRPVSHSALGARARYRPYLSQNQSNHSVNQSINQINQSTTTTTTLRPSFDGCARTIQSIDR